MPQQTSIADIICSEYAPRLAGYSLLEQAEIANGGTLNLYMAYRGGATSYVVKLTTTDQDEKEIPITNAEMAIAISLGQPFIRSALFPEGDSELLKDVASSHQSPSLPDVMGPSVVSEWGAISLSLPDESDDYILKIRIKRVGERPIKKSFNVSRSVIALAVSSGELPAFAALKSCQAAADLFADHDDLLNAIREQRELKAATAPLRTAPDDPPKLPRPKGL